MFVISLFPISKKVKSREKGYDNLAYKHCLNGRAGVERRPEITAPCVKILFLLSFL